MVELPEGADAKAKPEMVAATAADGRELPGTGVAVAVEAHSDRHLELTLTEAGASRRLKLDLLAVGEVESSQIGWSCWRRASCLQRESTVLAWQPAMPNHKAWKTLENTERETQWKELEKDPYFEWADWLKSLKPDEPKDEMEMRLWQSVLAMGPDWVVLKRTGYDFSGGAHGNSWRVRETFWADNGTARQVGVGELCGGEVPWNLLMPHLRKAYADWGKGGSYVDAKDLDKTLRESASVWPNGQGLVFSYDPYAIAPYSEGAPEFRISLKTFADAVDWKSPARLIWPKEAARRTK